MKMYLMCVLQNLYLKCLSEAGTGFSERGGGGLGCQGYGYFILKHFVIGQIMWCTDKNLADKILI